MLELQAAMRRSWRIVLAATLSMVLLVTLLVAYLLNASHKRYEADAVETTENLAVSVDGFLVAHYQGMESTLRSAATAFQQMHEAGRFSPGAFGALLASLREQVPDLVSIHATNQDGHPIDGAPDDPALQAALRMRDDFVRARDERRLIFGLPVSASAGGRPLFAVMHPLILPDGRFGGVAWIQTTNERLKEVFGTLKLGSTGVVTLIDSKGRILMRFPDPDRPLAERPLTLSSPQTLAALAGDRPHETYRARSSVDGLVRVASLRRIGDYPLYVAVGVGVDETLEPWRQQALVGVALLLVLYAGTAALLITLRRAWVREAQLHALRAVRQAHGHLAAVMAAVPDMLCEIDAQGILLSEPKGLRRPPGWPDGPIVGTDVNTFLSTKGQQKLRAALAQARDEGQAYGVRLGAGDPDNPHWFELSVARRVNTAGQEPTFIVLARDVTERRRAEKQIEQLAFYDHLTKLPNRRLFLDRLHQSMAASERTGRYCALLFLDIDHFKTVNDTFGHQQGDELLRMTAQRLRTLVRDGDTVARLGGDEFVVILEQLAPGEEEAEQLALGVAEKVVQRLGGVYELAGHGHQTTVSVGVTLYRGQALGQDDLLRRADLSMYQAKHGGRNAVRIFMPEQPRAPGGTAT